MNIFDKTKKYYPQLAKKGWYFVSNMGRNEKSRLLGKRRKSWLEMYSHLTILKLRTRRDLTAYSSDGIIMKNLCPVFALLKDKKFPDN